MASFQLPDILSYSRSFDLRANKHCRRITDASEAWIRGQEPPILTEEECETLTGVKAGLLTSLCFPTCDGPQLRLFADLCTLMVYSNARLWRQPLRSCWSGDGTGNGVDIFAGHTLLVHLVPRIQKIYDNASQMWKDRFTESIRKYRSAQLQVIENRVHVPGIAEYLDLLPDLSGIKIVLDFIEPAEGLDIEAKTTEDVERLRKHAVNIVSWTVDIVGYNVDQSVNKPYNLVSLLMVHKRLPAQIAAQQAGTMVKGTIDSFLDTERRIVSALKQPPAPSGRFSWIWSALTPAESTVEDKNSDKREIDDLMLWIQGLRDCIVGHTNWVYETDVFFGTKGEEVRGFGWVFLLPKTNPDGV
ncbi:isoprenoid synthase domain-containing protein [Armillaria luteobubalina]|uniref:Isoprenoid synthase domain-containing protein n=1 Tax=Armillaria luteobubalina TaxID=153913 RepID=A0AA39QFX4_9AGAR|nr:isoprenoid synthase domain-containing protein [Armillaria luteobubalina]